MNFDLWLEFEEVDPNSWDVKNEFANIEVRLSDGKTYGINVWTFGFMKQVLNEGSLFQIPPDLLVKELTRECIEKTISELLQKDSLEIVLNPSIVIDLKERKELE